MKKYKLLRILLIIIVAPFLVIGVVLFIISKAIRSISYLLMLSPLSAKQELEEILNVERSYLDIL